MEQQQEDRREEYREPELEEWGTVTDLTQTGLTRPGTDAKQGSRPSSGV